MRCLLHWLRRWPTDYQLSWRQRQLISPCHFFIFSKVVRYKILEDFFEKFLEFFENVMKIFWKYIPEIWEGFIDSSDVLIGDGIGNTVDGDWRELAFKWYCCILRDVAGHWKFDEIGMKFGLSLSEIKWISYLLSSKIRRHPHQRHSNLEHRLHWDPKSRRIRWY